MLRFLGQGVLSCYVGFLSQASEGYVLAISSKKAGASNISIYTANSHLFKSHVKLSRDEFNSVNLYRFNLSNINILSMSDIRTGTAAFNFQ